MMIAVSVAIWIVSGVWKIVHVSEFREVVRVHGVIPGGVWIGPTVGVGEITVGVFLGVLGDSRGRRSVLIGLVALLLALAFATYLSMVPDEAIERVGCGCHGRASSRDKTAALALSSGFCMLQAAQFIVMLMHRRPERSAGNMDIRMSGSD